MRFRNVKVPEGINVSRHSPVLDMLLLGVALLAGMAMVTLVLVWIGGALARQVPVSWENWLADRIIEAPAEDPVSDPITPVLQDLADRLAPHVTDGGEQRIVVHYLDEDMVNAFATLGGNIFIARGLIERLDSENALAMVMAHEIAHVVHRDAIAGLGSGVLLQALFAVLLGQNSQQLNSLLLGSGGLVAMSHSREVERDADAAALRAVMATYGHVAGADSLFIALKQSVESAGLSEPPALLSTHPQTDDRIAEIHASAEAAGWPRTGPLTPLPPVLFVLTQEQP